MNIFSILLKRACLFSICLYLATSSSLWASNSASLTPFLCCDGQYIETTIAGKPVWQNIDDHIYLYFDVPESFTFSAGSSVYLEITYYAEAYGTVAVNYDSARGDSLADKYYLSETHTRSSRVNSGEFVKSYHELLLPQFAGRQNGGADFRLVLTNGQDVPLSVHQVVIQNYAFNDRQFKYVLTKPWLSGYSGPSNDYVDRSTLDYKVMVGYQGWYRTPNDLDDRGWIHWCRNGRMIPENFTIDQWPDLSEYDSDELFRAGDVQTASGQPAYVFSSTTRKTVLRHFEWMRKYNIDGAFVQRFVYPETSGAWGHHEWVLHHAREAANVHGRIWAVEYDVSTLSNSAFDLYATIVKDWKWLVDVVRILEDPRYVYENGKPVVFIWGLSYAHNNVELSVANTIVDFFKNDPVYGGNYVIGGVPWVWRTMSGWYGHFQRYDGLQAWMPQDLTGYTADYQTLNGWGIDYFPHVWPGFSWANLKQLSGGEQYTPRNGGTFFWNKIHEALGSGASRLFIGMFDEYDEATAVMPMSDDPPDPPPAWGRFIDNDGRPGDWWLLLSGEAREMLLGYRPYNNLLPTEAELANRSNVGPQAWVDLGASNREHRLGLSQPADGSTSAENYAGRDCRYNTIPGSDLYFYFDVAETFVYKAEAGIDVTIEIEYFDHDNDIELSLQYDSTAGPYTLHPKIIATQGSQQWRSVRFEIDDAFFGNRQNADSDFRLRLTQSVQIHVDRVWVTLEAGSQIFSGFPWLYMLLDE